MNSFKLLIISDTHFGETPQREGAVEAAKNFARLLNPVEMRRLGRQYRKSPSADISVNLVDLARGKQWVDLPGKQGTHCDILALILAEQIDEIVKREKINAIIVSGDVGASGVE